MRIPSMALHWQQRVTFVEGSVEDASNLLAAKGIVTQGKPEMIRQHIDVTAVQDPELNSFVDIEAWKSVKLRATRFG